MSFEVVTICNANLEDLSPRRHTGVADGANVETTRPLDDRKLIP